MAGEHLKVISGGMAGETIDPAGGVVLGRTESPPGDLGGDVEISRRHAAVTVRPNGDLAIEDLGSSNGTLVNSRRITEPTVLRSGDRIRVGSTDIEVVGGTTRTPAPGTVIGHPQIAVALPVAASATVPVGGPTLEPGPAPSTSASSSKKFLVGFAVLAVIVAAVSFVVVVRRHGKSSSSAEAISNDCGASIGKNGASVGFVAYVESNVAKAGKNTVIAIPYKAGDLTPMAMSECPTGGSGSTDLSDSGVLDANNQIAVDRDRGLLFAANQGSDSIAVFKIRSNGALQAVAGSPFDSGGMAPASLGVSGDFLVVNNKAQDGVRDLSKIAPNYTTFEIGGSGKLTRVAGSNIKAEPGSSPTDAYVPPAGGVAFSTEESGPIRAMTIGTDGVLAEAAGSPYDPEPTAFPAGFDPAKKFALGMVSSPTQKTLYVSYSTIPALIVYAYDASGALTYRSRVPNAGSYLPCWNVITPDGKFLYTANADTDNVSAFDLADPANPVQIQTFAFQTPGNPWNAQVDPTGKYLFVNTPRDTIKVPAGEGNTQHVLRIGNDGTLTEVSSSPVKLPVPAGTQPQGLAIVIPSAG